MWKSYVNFFSFFSFLGVCAAGRCGILISCWNCCLGFSLTGIDLNLESRPEASSLLMKVTLFWPFEFVTLPCPEVVPVKMPVCSAILKSDLLVVVVVVVVVLVVSSWCSLEKHFWLLSKGSGLMLFIRFKRVKCIRASSRTWLLGYWVLWTLLRLVLTVCDSRIYGVFCYWL